MEQNWLNIVDKVVIVTGGSSGIGLAIVKELCEQGAKVINADIHEENFKSENLSFAATDVSSRASVEALIEYSLKKFHKIDALVNNAGINFPALLADVKNPAGEYELNDVIFDRMMNINQRGVYLMAQAVGRVLEKQGNGVIINMSSESGLEGSEGQSAYAATKAAIYSYTRSWAKELGKKGVRVVGLAPGIMEATGLRTLQYEMALAYTRGITVDELRAGYSKTSTIPLGRSGKLSEVANVVAFLVSDRSSYISGVTINVAGGKTRG